MVAIGSRARRSTILISTRSTLTWYQVSSKVRRQDPGAAASSRSSRARKNSTALSSSSSRAEKAVGCHESPEYLEAAAHRKKDGAGELEIVIVERASETHRLGTLR